MPSDHLLAKPLPSRLATPKADLLRNPSKGAQRVTTDCAISRGWGQVRWARRTGIMARKARPRWEISFFSTSVYSASDLVSPSGTKIGS